jgi:hypothetical protein
MVYLQEKRQLGKLCIRNHDYNGTGKSVRYISSGNCVECALIMSAKWKESHPVRFRELQKRYKANLTPQARAKRNKWQQGYYLSTTKPKRRKAREGKRDHRTKEGYCKT